MQRTCDRCGYISSNPLCKACVLLEGLAKGEPKTSLYGTRRPAGVIGEGDHDAGRGGGHAGGDRTLAAAAGASALSF